MTGPPAGAPAGIPTGRIGGAAAGTTPSPFFFFFLASPGAAPGLLGLSCGQRYKTCFQTECSVVAPGEFFRGGLIFKSEASFGRFSLG
jgi:hypothetical protein